MHEPVKASVEDYLAGSKSLPGDFMTHLSACRECSDELAELKAQATLLHVLRASEDVETRAGFYARVIERIDAQRQSSIWSLFLEPAFGRRLAVASGVLALMMGVYLVGSEPRGVQDGTGAQIASQPHRVVTMLPGEDEPGLVLGTDPDQDRGAVLANLVTYRPEQ